MGVIFRVNGVVQDWHGVIDVSSAGALPPAPPPPPALVDLIPPMSSASQGGFVVTSSSEYHEGSTYASPHKAFNRIITDGWEESFNCGCAATLSAPVIKNIKSPTPIQIKKYTIQIRAGADFLCFKEWKLYGRNNASEAFTLIDTVPFFNWVADSRGTAKLKEFVPANQGAYSEHEFRFTASGVQGEYVEMHLYG